MEDSTSESKTGSGNVGNSVSRSDSAAFDFKDGESDLVPWDRNRVE